MKLSLSGRLFEARGGYTLTLEEFLTFAKQTGYHGVEIRYPQAPAETPKTRLGEVKRMLADLGLTWVFGTVEDITKPDMFEKALRTMDNNLSCGCLFTRFSIFQAPHIAAAQKFADEAAKRGAKLVMQLHAGTLPDNVPHTLDTFQKIGRKNLGLAFDPNHLVFDGDLEYAAAVRKLAKLIVSVSLQNFKLAPAGAPAAERINVKGKDLVRALPGDPAAIDFAAVFGELKGISFDGFVTVMCDAYPGMDSRELARRYHEHLSKLV